MTVSKSILWLVLGLSSGVWAEEAANKSASVIPQVSSQVSPQTQAAQVVGQLLAQTRRGDFVQAKQNLTQASWSWFDRWAAYDIHAWLPKQLVVTHQEARQGGQWVWLSQAAPTKTAVPQQNKEDSMILVLKPEGNQMKVDIPESMQAKFGSDWSQTAIMMENTYNLAVSQIGKENSRAVLESLLRSQ